MSAGRAPSSRPCKIWTKWPTKLDLTLLTPHLALPDLITRLFPNILSSVSCPVVPSPDSLITGPSPLYSRPSGFIPIHYLQYNIPGHILLLKLIKMRCRKQIRSGITLLKRSQSWCFQNDLTHFLPQVLGRIPDSTSLTPHFYSVKDVLARTEAGWSQSSKNPPSAVTLITSTAATWNMRSPLYCLPGPLISGNVSPSLAAWWPWWNSYCW